ncbi:MAG: hypothetical protein GY938_24675 [Ketobacter sp.]|nr:hypothetical protein [Ketobacter sp.]
MRQVSPECGEAVRTVGYRRRAVRDWGGRRRGGDRIPLNCHILRDKDCLTNQLAEDILP